jgi:hypothetical protein
MNKLDSQIRASGGGSSQSSEGVSNVIVTGVTGMGGNILIFYQYNYK